MQIEYGVTGEGNNRLMSISHQNAQLQWHIGFAGGVRDMKPMVRDINAYWAKLSVQRQTAIFKQYEVIHRILDEVANGPRLVNQLRREMEKLFELHPYVEAEAYIRRFNMAKYPKDLKNEYGPGAPATVLTYLWSDYKDLLVMTLLLRVALPVIGTYIKVISAVVGSPYRESKALDILATTHLIESPPYRKLTDYIDTYTKGADNPLSAVINGLGTEQRVSWLVAQTIVRKVLCAGLVYSDEMEDAQSLVRSIYNFVRNLMESPDKKHGGQIRDKVPDASERMDENISRADLIKVKQPVSEGNMVAYSVYAENYRRMATRIDASIPQELVTAAMVKLRADNNYSADSTQITLIQWVLNTAIPARGIPQLEYEALLCAAGVSQALLWHWGFSDLAALVTAKRELIPPTKMLGVVRNKPTKDQQAKLIALYPHYSMPVKGDKPRFDGTMAKEKLDSINLANNPAMLAINTLSNDMASVLWYLRLPEEYQRPLGFTAYEDAWLVSQTIRNQLADLILKIAQLK